MKKVFIGFLLTLFCTLNVFAAGTSGTYNGNLAVAVDGFSMYDKQQNVIVADNGSSVVITIKGFVFSSIFPAMDIVINADIAGNGDLTITSIDVPINVDVNAFSGSISGGVCSINMDLSALFQSINVTFNGNKVG